MCDLGVKTPPSMENFFNLIIVFEKWVLNFGVYKKIQNTPLKTHVTWSPWLLTRQNSGHFEFSILNSLIARVTRHFQEKYRTSSMSTSLTRFLDELEHYKSFSFLKIERKKIKGLSSEKLSRWSAYPSNKNRLKVS